MRPPLSWTGLIANAPPPSYRVTIPAGRESVYELVAPLFVALAITSGGIWLARGRRLRARTSRLLLWLSAGGLSIAYSSWWVWEHRGDLVHSPSLADLLAIFMPGLWVLVSAVVLVRGWVGRGKTEQDRRTSVGEAVPNEPKDGGE
jgi:hypothetical protein